MKKRIVVFISRQGSNLNAILDNCYQQNGILKDLCEVILVVADRVTAVPGLEKAQHYGIPTKLILKKNYKDNIAFSHELISELAPLYPDYVVLAGFMSILSHDFVKTFRNRILNIHPADPKLYKGPNGYKWAYQQFLPSTKITVQLVEEEVDNGNILAQQEVDLQGVRSLQDVISRGKAVEHQLYSQTLLKIFKNHIPIDNCFQ